MLQQYQDVDEVSFDKDNFIVMDESPLIQNIILSDIRHNKDDDE